MPDLRKTERRRSRRVRMGQAIRVRPANPKDPQFEEISTTKDVSQDGVSFVTKLTVYYEGLRVFVTLPYHGPTSQQNYQYRGQVARVEDLENNQTRVAIKFVSSADKKTR
jgi:PilZ domain